MKEYNMIIICVKKHNQLFNSIIKYCIKNNIVNNELKELLRTRKIKVLNKLSYWQYNNYYIVPNDNVVYIYIKANR